MSRLSRPSVAGILPLVALGLAFGVAGCDTLKEMGILSDDGPADGGGATMSQPPGAAPGAGAPTRGKPGDAKADPKAVAPAPKPIEEPFTYNPIGKRDPFDPFLKDQTAVVDSAPRTALQRYDIDQYEPVGIVLNSDPPCGLVQDPSGRGHVLKVGTYIGKNWGKVTDIQADRIIVTEEYQTLDNELVTHNITMALPSAEVVEDE